MNSSDNTNSFKFHILLLVVAIVLWGMALPGMSVAKSMYVNKDLNANSPISAYDIQSAPNYLVWQQTSTPTRYGGAGLAIDTDSEILFVTFEGSGTLDIVDANSLAVLGQVTAPNAYNLAGIVVDQEQQKVYTVDRGTNHLYVYSWDAANKTLTNDIILAPYYVPLLGFYYGAHGIALDETNDLLYVADVSNIVKVFKTSDWSAAGTVPVAAQKPMGIALDVKNGLLYTGNAYPDYGGTGDLVQTDLQTGAETTVNIRTLAGGVPSDCVVGLAVDPATSLVYITTGNQGSGGSDRILVFDSAMNLLHATPDIGNPTGIVVPGKEISYNPLNLSKDDKLGEGVCSNASQPITYDICYDNLANSYDVTNVVIVDTLPALAAFISASNGGVYDSTARTVTWNVGALAAGTGQECVHVTVSVDSSAAGTTITNSGAIDSEETPPTTQNESTVICSNQPPVAVIDGPYTADEGEIVTLNASGSSDPDNDSISYAWDLNNNGSYDDATGVTADVTRFDNDTLTVGLQVTDSKGAIATTSTTVTWYNVAPVAALTAPALVPVNTTFSVLAAITDPGTADTHTAVCNFGDGGASHVGTVDQAADSVNASSTVVNDHTDYMTPGIYTVTMNVTDDDGAAGFETAIVVAYDPSAGFVTGGGWIASPAGADKRPGNETLAGKANFGFVSKYKKGASVPDGQTEFNFQVADLNFHSSSYEWLVVNQSGKNAQFKGAGTINGTGDYKFMLWARDDAQDTFRIRIWVEEEDEVNDSSEIVETVVYDNGFDQPIAGGSVLIHTK